jgi:hypothetical protein
LTPLHWFAAIACSAPGQCPPEDIVDDEDFAPSGEQEAPPAHDVAAKQSVRSITGAIAAIRFMASLLAWVLVVALRLR